MTISRPRAALPLGLVLLTLLLLRAVPAMAITNGQADGDTHPAVGAMLLPDTSGKYVSGYNPVCSGTLVSARVFMTASHCLYGEDPADTAYVTFSEDASDDAHPTVLTGRYKPNPAFNPRTLANDVSAIVLDATVAGITPAQAPTLNALGALRTSGALSRGTSLTVVGYGSSGMEILTGFGPRFPYPDMRQYAIGGFVKLGASQLTMAMQQRRGFGGACYGDSGGPTFLGAAPDDGDVVLGVTSSGDVPCYATNVVTRADTANAVDFIQGLIADPDGYDSRRTATALSTSRTIRHAGAATRSVRKSSSTTAVGPGRP